MIILSATSMWLRNSLGSAISLVSEKTEFEFQRGSWLFQALFLLFL